MKSKANDNAHKRKQNSIAGRVWNLKKKEGDKHKKNENPFDKFANNRKKHEVLNRRVKGEDRNVGRAREKVREQAYLYIIFEIMD